MWLDPALAQKEVAAIQAAFEQADPDNKDDYKKNAEAYIAKLKELDEAYKSGLKDVLHKDFVTQHAAFGYLAGKSTGSHKFPLPAFHRNKSRHRIKWRISSNLQRLIK